MRALMLILLLLTLPVAACRGVLTACKSNLKNIATALEMYATDHKGRYPAHMAQLIPDYLKVIPTCPSAGRDTYSVSYFQRRQPDCFVVYCCGSNHGKSGMPVNFPVCTPDGLIDRPDGVSLSECRHNLAQRRLWGGHHLVLDSGDTTLLGCYGQHAHEGVAVLESSPEGFLERATAALPPRPTSPLPPWRAWVGSLVLVSGLAWLSRCRARVC